MRVLTDLCAREWSYAAGAEFVQPTVGRIHFEFSRQNLNRNVTIPSASTVKTRHNGRPRLVWKRPLLASRGHPVRSPACHTSYIDPTHQNQHLHPAIESSGTTIVPTVQLLTKDKRPALRHFVDTNRPKVASMMNARLNQQSFGPYHETGLIKTIPQLVTTLQSMMNARLNQQRFWPC